MNKLLNKISKGLNRRYRLFKARNLPKILHVVDRAVINDSQRSIYQGKKKINLFSPVWGSYIDMFFDYIIPGVLQEGNVPRLVGDGHEAEMVIYTQKGENSAMIEKRLSALPETARCMSISFVEYDMSTADKNSILITTLISHIEKCLAERAISIQAMPDNFFGNKTLSNAIKLIQGKGHMCLGTSYARLSREAILNSQEFVDLKEQKRNIENDDLVELLFKYGHHSFASSFDNVDENITHAGMSLRHIEGNIYSMVSNLPTVMAADFQESDLKFFRSSGIINQWDRLWLRELIKKNRYKVSGSSDMTFFVDITSDQEKQTPFKGDNLYNDAFLEPRNRLLQNYVCNAFCFLLRRKGAVPENIDAGSEQSVKSEEFIS